MAKLATVLVLVAALAAGLWLALAARDAAVPPAPGAPAAADARAPAPAATVAPPVDALPVRSAAPVETPAAAAVAGPATMKVRCVDAEHRPLAGAQLLLEPVRDQDAPLGP